MSSKVKTPAGWNDTNGWRVKTPSGWKKVVDVKRKTPTGWAVSYTHLTLPTILLV